jgi:hypothetical protein
VVAKKNPQIEPELASVIPALTIRILNEFIEKIKKARSNSDFDSGRDTFFAKKCPLAVQITPDSAKLASFCFNRMVRRPG